MAGKMKCGPTIKKKSGVKSGAPLPKGAVVDEVSIQDNGDNTLTVLGKSAAGNIGPIDSVADITAKSADESLITVDPATGATVPFHAVGPAGKTTISLTATWKDGSIGPLTLDVPATVTAGPANSLVVDLGTATTH